MAYRFYISGPISNNSDFVEDFERARRNIAIWAVDIGVDYGIDANDIEIISPVEMARVLPESFSYEDYMAVDMFLLTKCDAIYMISGYEKSKGALAELLMAKSMGLEIYYESEEQNEQRLHKTV